MRKTIMAGWGSSTLNLAYPIGISIPLDDRGTASAEGEITNYKTADARSVGLRQRPGTEEPAQVKGTCKRADSCGRVGLPKSQDVSCREPDALGPATRKRGRKGKAANHANENLSGVAIRRGRDRPDEYGKTDGQEAKRGVATHAYRSPSGSTPDASIPS